VAIDSTNGTVCSYRFENMNSINNDYQIRIKKGENLNIGLYFYSEFWSQIIDYKIFDEDYCNQMKYCQVLNLAPGKETESEKEIAMVFSLDNS
jgi:hypothetical protein